MATPLQPSFDRPLTIADPIGNIEIASAQDALEAAEWPDQQQQERVRAAAQAVVDGRLTGSDARTSFASAAERAGVLVFT